MGLPSINSNQFAASAASSLNSHYGRLSTSVERLSSGLRINSAADDAAGLAIRELMRADVAALNQGMRNANDAISMLQVADGALAIIDEKLIRMKELAEQAATGTYDSTQRLMISSEYQAMAAEIDRIARATDFNGIKLLDGSLSGAYNGKGLNSTGAMKIHFGSANDSAEDYYYVEIGACTIEALGLGMDPFAAPTVTVETFVYDQKTFKPSASYIEYTDPDTGRTYYSDGDFYFSNINNPAGTSLSWETDRDIIEKLQTKPATTTSWVTYRIYKHKDTGIEYYSRDNGRTFTSDPHNPDGNTLDASSPIINRLEQTVNSVRIQTVWEIYEDPDDNRIYTCDGGLTFVPDVDQPASNILDSRNPADKAVINAYKPALTAREMNLPSISTTYERYQDTRTGRTYYSSDGGKTFVRDMSHPDTTKLDPSISSDNDIILHLKAVQDYTYTSVRYDIFEDTVTGIRYYTSDKGQSFVSDYRDPNNTLVSDQAILGRLKPILYTFTGTINYDTYEDTANNHKRYYSGDGGKTFFDNINDPEGSVLDVTAPGYNNLVANFVKLNATTSLITEFNGYSLPNGTRYYTKDGGQTFYNSLNGGNIVLDASNSADLAIIRTMYPYCSWNSLNTYYDIYYDPDTGTRYYSLRGGPGEQFKLSAGSTSIALDAAKPDQKVIIDRLKPVIDTYTQYTDMSYPAVYHIYEDTVTGTVYYSPDNGKSFTTRPNDPYNTNYYLDMSDPGDQNIRDRLQPTVELVRRVELVRASGGSESAVLPTQESAQQALVAIDRAIVSKDKIRAHLGALQNRLENTVANLSIQSQNLVAAESRISDADVAAEMIDFVRSQILTQSAVAMLGQANSYPHMLARLLTG